jgi:acetyl-CoA synthetase
MRRMIAEDDLANLGDTSTLADPGVVDDLVKNRGARRHDIIEIGGENLDLFDVEAVLNTHPGVAQAVAVGAAEAGGATAIWGFVTVRPDEPATDILLADLKGILRRELGAHAAPKSLQVVAALPKLRSGEVARAVLKAIAEGADPGDLSGLADASVVAALIKARAAVPA